MKITAIPAIVATFCALAASLFLPPIIMALAEGETKRARFEDASHEFKWTLKEINGLYETLTGLTTVRLKSGRC